MAIAFGFVCTLAGELEARWAMIEIRLLQAAVTVEEERNVTRAADRLGLTQPALSKQLAELEERVGFVLFERSSQRFEVTEGGASFVEHARTALAEVERAVHAGRAASLGTDSILCIVKSPYVDPYFISVMRTVRLPLHPQLELRFSSHFSNEALRLLRAGEADLAITCGLSEMRGASSTVLTQDPFFVALPAGDMLRGRRDLELTDLDGRRWVLLERTVNPAIYDKLRQTLVQEGIHPTEIQHVQQAEEAAALVMQRDSVALLTKCCAWRVADDAIIIRPLNDARFIIKTYLSARLAEESRLVSDFTRALSRKLKPKAEQLSFTQAS